MTGFTRCRFRHAAPPQRRSRACCRPSCWSAIKHRTMSGIHLRLSRTVLSCKHNAASSLHRWPGLALNDKTRVFHPSRSRMVSSDWMGKRSDVLTLIRRRECRSATHLHDMWRSSAHSREWLLIQWTCQTRRAWLHVWMGSSRIFALGLARYSDTPQSLTIREGNQNSRLLPYESPFTYKLRVNNWWIVKCCARCKTWINRLVSSYQHLWAMEHHTRIIVDF